jgi:hypothetical protein
VTHTILCRTLPELPTLGLLTIVHPLPVFCSMRVASGVDHVDPTAQQSLDVTQVAPMRRPALLGEPGEFAPSTALSITGILGATI